MASAGLSLVGFMDQEQGVNYLANICIPQSPIPAAVLQEWQNAVSAIDRKNPVVPNPGAPDIQSLAMNSHLQTLSQDQNIQLAMQNGAQFALVEIDPLLAFQFSIIVGKVDGHCAVLSNPPTQEQLINLCLPLATPTEDFKFSGAAQSIVLTSKSLNFRVLHQGVLGQNAAGIVFGPASPHVHVALYNGRYYLQNGFHRAYGCRLAGATHIACILKEVKTAQDAGIFENGSTFGLPLLESADPPTIGHYTTGRAHSVNIKQLTRIIHISWSDHIMLDE